MAIAEALDPREVEEMADEKAGRRIQMTVGLTDELMERIAAIAARKGLKPSTLVRMWTIEKVEEEERRRESRA